MVTARLPHLPVAAMAAIAVLLVLPAGALASGGKPKHHSTDCGVSAVCVYREQGPTPTGPKPLGTSGTVVPLSPAASRALAAKGGKEKRMLRSLATSGLGVERLVGNEATSGHGGPPSTIGAAFDLGPGPTALFALLLAAAAGLALRSGLRRRHR